MSTGFSSVCSCAIKGNRGTDMRCLKTTLLYITHKGASLTLCSDLVKKIPEMPNLLVQRPKSPRWWIEMSHSRCSEQAQRSLTPHLDSFTKSSQNLPPPKPHHNVLRTVVRSLSLGYACSSALACQGHGRLRGCVLWLGGKRGLLGTEQWGSSHHWFVVRLHSLTSICLSIHAAI